MPQYNKPTETGLLARHAEQINRNKRDIDVMQDRDGVSAWIPTTLLNGYANAGGSFSDVRYRLHGDQIDFQGHIDVSGATSGTVAFVLEEFIRPSIVLSFLTDIISGPATFGICRVAIALNGEVTLYWPAT